MFQKKITEEIENNLIDYFENFHETNLSIATNNFGLKITFISTQMHCMHEPQWRMFKGLWKEV